MKNTIHKILAGIGAVILLAAVAGCVSATGSRTTTVNGVTTTETIMVKGFLEDIADGTYSSSNSLGNVMTLSTSSATPDQQSIATLSSGVVSLGQAAFALAAKAPTNSAPSATTTLPAAKGP